MTPMPKVDAARLFFDIAQDLMAQPDLAAARKQVVSMASKVVGCSSASIVRTTSPQTWSVLAATDDDLAARLAQILSATLDGPVAQAQATGCRISSRSLERDSRWPEYAKRVVSVTAIRSEAAYPLHVDGQDFGVLAMHSTTDGYFSEDECAMAELLAGYAAMTMTFAAERNKVANLEIALESNREIGKAIGILVASHRITEDEAFGALRSESQHSHRKLRDVAADVVLTGELPSLALRLRRQQSQARHASPSPRRLVVV
jgi:GAF domain-containing protein